MRAGVFVYFVTTVYPALGQLSGQTGQLHWTLCSEGRVLGFMICRRCLKSKLLPPFSLYTVPPANDVGHPDSQAHHRHSVNNSLDAECGAGKADAILMVAD